MYIVCQAEDSHDMSRLYFVWRFYKLKPDISSDSTSLLGLWDEVLWSSQPNGVMSSTVSLPHFYWAGLVLLSG